MSNDDWCTLPDDEIEAMKTAEVGDIEPIFTRHTFDTLTDDEYMAILKMYRVLRIRVPHAPPNSIIERSGQWPDTYAGPHPDGFYYGKSRTDARRFLWLIATELNWHAYLGSK